jgi:hypothetical protein
MCRLAVLVRDDRIYMVLQQRVVVMLHSSLFRAAPRSRSDRFDN